MGQTQAKSSSEPVIGNPTNVSKTSGSSAFITQPLNLSAGKKQSSSSAPSVSPAFIPPPQSPTQQQQVQISPPPIPPPSSSPQPTAQSPQQPGDATTTTAVPTTPKPPREYKILLLGAGDSGKSTLVKQMHVVHLQGFTSEAKKEFKPVIYTHVVFCMATILKHLQTAGQSSGSLSPGNEKAAQRVLDCFDRTATSPDSLTMTEELGDDLKMLWSDPAVKQGTEDCRSESFVENARYYFESLNRICAAEYEPTDQDVVGAPSKTTGFTEVTFSIGGAKYRVVDVGGQRSERRKWAQTFCGVSAVIFCAALSEYDQRLYEAKDASRLEESLRLWKDVCTSKWFTRSVLFLFLNKWDVFEKKIVQGKPDLVEFVPDYTGPQRNVEQAAQFLKDKYLAQVKPLVVPAVVSEKGLSASTETITVKRPVKHFYTCATDSENIRKTFVALQEYLQKVLPP